MDRQDKLLDKVSKKTNVSKQDILSLAQDFQKKDLSDEKNMRELIYTLSHLAHKEVNEQQVEKILRAVQNKNIPSDISKLM